jgi:hypothetical protein
VIVLFIKLNILSKAPFTNSLPPPFPSFSYSSCQYETDAHLMELAS